MALLKEITRREFIKRSAFGVGALALFDIIQNLPVVLTSPRSPQVVPTMPNIVPVVPDATPAAVTSPTLAPRIPTIVPPPTTDPMLSPNYWASRNVIVTPAAEGGTQDQAAKKIFAGRELIARRYQQTGEKVLILSEVVTENGQAVITGQTLGTSTPFFCMNGQVVEMSPNDTSLLGLSLRIDPARGNGGIVLVDVDATGDFSRFNLNQPVPSAPPQVFGEVVLNGTDAAIINSVPSLKFRGAEAMRMTAGNVLVPNERLLVRSVVVSSTGDVMRVDTVQGIIDFSVNLSLRDSFIIDLRGLRPDQRIILPPPTKTSEPKPTPTPEVKWATPAGAVVNGETMTLNGEVYAKATIKTAHQGEVKVWQSKSGAEILAETPKPLTATDIPQLAKGENVNLKGLPTGSRPLWGELNVLIGQRMGIDTSIKLSPIVSIADKLRLITDSKGQIFLNISFANGQGVVDLDKALFIPVTQTQAGPFLQFEENVGLISLEVAKNYISTDKFATVGFTELYFVTGVGGDISAASYFNEKSSEFNFQTFGKAGWR